MLLVLWKIVTNEKSLLFVIGYVARFLLLYTMYAFNASITFNKNLKVIRFCKW